MKKTIAVLYIIVIGIGVKIGFPSEKPDRSYLMDLMDRYLTALSLNEPSGIPFADDVTMVENARKTPVGSGLWETATGGPTDFKIIVADPDAGEIAFMGVIEENKKPTIAAIRLKVTDGKIREIDHLAVHAGDRPLNPNMSKVRPALLEGISDAERTPRETMRIVANSYYEAIVQDNGEIGRFSDECQRRENGAITTNKPMPSDKDTDTNNFSVFSRMTCSDQLSTGVMSYITDITDRRILAIDETKGLVFAFSIIRHDGEPKVMKIVGVPGITERPNQWGPFDNLAAHIFKIRNGLIYEIEAIGVRTSHGVTNGWE